MKIIKYFKTIKRLRAELKVAEAKAKNFQNVCHSLLEKSTPEIVIEKVMDDKIKWYDPKKLPPEEQKQYYIEAQAILRSPVYKNEKKAYTDALTKSIVISSKNHQHTENLRYSINGVQTLWERFEKIKDPETTPKENTSPHSSL